MELEGWKMIDNISDCVKNIFLYFTASGNLVWICVWIISWRYNTSMINIYRSLCCCDISQSEESSKGNLQKLIYVCSLILCALMYSHKRQNELMLVWDFKPVWKQVLFTWSFISAAFQNVTIFWWSCVGISFQVVFTWYFNL